MRSFVLWLVVGGGFVWMGGSAEAQPNGAPAAAPATQPAASSPDSQPARGFNNLPKELVLDLGKGVKMELVLIPAGEFMMGSTKEEQDKVEQKSAADWAKETDFGRNWSFRNEGPQHKVKINKPFYMGKFEVTQEQWKAIPEPANVKPGEHKIMLSISKDRKENDRLPALYVTWDACQYYCAKLSGEIGQKVRLPSEAEWEYACRAGTTTQFSYGDDPDYSRLSDYAWFRGNRGKTLLIQVGQKKPNPWGLYDMHGNQWEWCQDEWHDNYNAAPADEKLWISGKSKERVLRGGCISSTGGECRSTYRINALPDDSGGEFGFRVVVEVPENP